MVGRSKAPVELVSIDKLEIHPDNPRQGDIGAIVTSIEENGFYGTLVAQQSTSRVLAGNHRLQAAIAAGLKELPVYWVDVNDIEARKILLADNRTSDLASYDDNQLLHILKDLIEVDNSLLGTGFDGDDLDDLIKDLEDSPPGDFKTFGDDLETNHTCPKCGYEF
jgi:ParB-like chromosome segregation protein Spo0J